MSSAELIDTIINSELKSEEKPLVVEAVDKIENVETPVLDDKNVKNALDKIKNDKDKIKKNSVKEKDMIQCLL